MPSACGHGADSGTPTRRRLLRLQTFGALGITSDGELQLQRRQMLMLAVLAAAGPAGVTRDRLLGLLWPGLDLERGRHALDQSLYGARRAIGADAVVAGPTAFVLDPRVLPSDVADFARARENGDLKTAVAVYAGPFLDGVYVADAAEFERWADGRRKYFADEFVQALSRLAAAANASGDHAAAVVHLRRAAASDPLSGSVAHALMLALAATGDRSAALEVGRVHATLVKNELEAVADTAVRDLMEQLRAGSGRASSAPAATTRPAPPSATVSTPANSLVGTLLGGTYRIERELGAGGMATVYLARDLKHDRHVALKVLRPELGALLGAERFLNEIRITARLDHPHILTLIDSGSVEGMIYCVLPYVSGGSLRARMNRDRQLPIEDALSIARQIASALDYAHRSGIVHRDIKPENILFREGDAALTDFGIALAVHEAGGDRVTESGFSLGTPRYMSPEQATGDQALDGRSDLYSLAAVLYEMLTGEPAHSGSTARAVIAKLLTERPTPVRVLRDTISDGVEAAVMRGLAKARADRFATARDFAEALAMPDGAPQASPRRLGVAWPRLRVRRRNVALLALAGILVAVLALSRSPLVAKAGAILDPKRVAVAAFANRTGDASLETLGDITADRLASALTEIQFVRVVDPLAVQGVEARAREGSAGAIALAHGLGAGSVLWGSYYRRGDSIEFRAQLSDTRTSQVVVPILSGVGPARNPSAAIEQLREHAMAALAWHFDPRVEEVENSNRPSSYEAYREFVARDDAGQPSFNCRFAECGNEHWRRAYALDTNFTLPLILILQEGDGLGGCEFADSIAEALRLRHDRLPAHDRAALDAAVAGCHGQRGLQLDAAREALEAGRSTPDAVYLSTWLRRAGYFREAIAALEPIDPAVVENALAVPYHLLGEHDKELAAAEAAHHRAPDNLGLMAQEAFAYVGLGRLVPMGQVLEEMLKVPANVENRRITPAWTFTWVAADLEAHGHAAEARDLRERALAVHRSRPREEQDNHEDTYAAILYGAGHWVEARTVVQHIIATAPASARGDPEIWSRGAQSYLGGIAAHLGDRREMDRVDRWLASRTGPYLAGVPTFDRARIAAIRGDRERAVALIQLAIDQGYPLFRRSLGLHFDPDFKTLWGYPPFEDLRRPKGSSEAH